MLSQARPWKLGGSGKSKRVKLPKGDADADLRSLTEPHYNPYMNTTPLALHSTRHTIMPSSDYTNAVGGGLKLKGAKDAGVKKHKKKKPRPEATSSSKAADSTEKEQEDGTTTLIQKALADEEIDGEDAQAALKLAKAESNDGAGAGAGKTEAQKRHEEIRRKRAR